MILAVVTFLLARVGITAVLNWMVANTSALYILLALMIFAGIGIAFIPGKTSKKGGAISFVAGILGYVSVSYLGMIANVVAIVLAAAIAIVPIVILWKLFKTVSIAKWLKWLLLLL